nr:integrase, catalytic region, zinc finger, CCHC-type, peptidase aspartic, catalytic [Tanacetum cinerariifolium]
RTCTCHHQFASDFLLKLVLRLFLSLVLEGDLLPTDIYKGMVDKRALCYPKNDREDLGKLGAKGDIGFFIGYSANSCAYRVYNRRTKKIIETIHITFDEISAMAFEQYSSKPGLQGMTYGQISSRLDLTEEFFEIDSFLLAIPFHDKTSLVSDDRAFFIMLVFE